MIADEAWEVAQAIAERLNGIDEIHVWPSPRVLAIDVPRQGSLTLVSAGKPGTFGTQGQEVRWTLEILTDSDTSTMGSDWPEQEIATLMSADPDRGLYGRLRKWTLTLASGRTCSPRLENLGVEAMEEGGGFASVLTGQIVVGL